MRLLSGQSWDGVGKHRENQAISSSTAFVGCGELGSVHRQLTPGRSGQSLGKECAELGEKALGLRIPPTHSLTCLCSSPDFLGRSVGLWAELSSGCPMGRESSLGYYSAAHMLFVSGNGSVPHSGQVFEASGSWKIQSTFQEQSDDSLITQHRAFSCDHSFLGKR